MRLAKRIAALEAQLQAKEQELAEAKAGKAGAFQTIYEIRDAAYGVEWGGGKNQDEIIGQVKRLKAHYDETTSIEYIKAESAQLAARDATIAGLRETLTAIRAVNVDEFGQVADAAINRLIASDAAQVPPPKPDALGDSMEKAASDPKLQEYYRQQNKEWNQ